MIFTRAALALACLLPALPADSQPGRRDGGGPLRVLFVGNSYTYFNNLPYLLEALARSEKGSRPVQTRMVVRGGATLQDLWEKGDARKAIGEGPWDYVVLQDQSTLGTCLVEGVAKVGDPQYLWRFAGLFDRDIKKAGAAPVFYLTWARRGTPDREQAALNYAYGKIARDLGDRVAPVGVVWQRVRRANPKLELYLQDRSHPTGAGSYAAACVLYATLCGKSPVGLTRTITGPPVDVQGTVDRGKSTPLVELSAEDAALIQQTAWETYQKAQDRGGYLPAEKPPPLELPRLPAGQKLTGADLEGTWTGPNKFFPGTEPATMELTLRRRGAAWEADLKIRFKGNPASDMAPKITDVRVTDTGLSFRDAKGLAGAPVKYEAVFTGKALAGIMVLKAEGKPLYGIGTWELKRGG
jgi:hypothetical protein